MPRHRAGRASPHEEDRMKHAELGPIGGRPTSYQVVRDAMRRDIISGAFGDDGRMIMRDLTLRYGISAVPIREALSQLEGEGLVAIEANRGAVARKIDANFVREVYEIRRELEPMLVERATEHIDSSILSEISQIEADFEKAAAAGRVEGVIDLNRRFHNRIYAVRPNTEAIRLLAQHGATLSIMRELLGFGTERLDSIVAEHRNLIDACARHDARTARAVAWLHITNSMNNMLDRL